MSGKSILDLLEAIDEVDEEKILQQPNLVNKMDLLAKKGLIEIDENKIELTATGKIAKETGQIKIEKTANGETAPKEKEGRRLGLSFVPLKKFIFRRKR